MCAGSAFIRNHNVYTLAKAGVQVITESLALELGPEITVNAVSPGQIYESLPDIHAFDPDVRRALPGPDAGQAADPPRRGRRDDRLLLPAQQRHDHRSHDSARRRSRDPHASSQPRRTLAPRRIAQPPPQRHGRLHGSSIELVRSRRRPADVLGRRRASGGWPDGVGLFGPAGRPRDAHSPDRSPGPGCRHSSIDEGTAILQGAAGHERLARSASRPSAGCACASPSGPGSGWPRAAPSCTRASGRRTRRPCCPARQSGPRYITRTRSHRWRIVLRSCEMKM